VIHPLLFEINTRCWLRELSSTTGREVTLATVPNKEVARWGKLGFTHIWLMGIWRTGPRSRAVALASPHLREICTKAFGHCNGEEIIGSPYAISHYLVGEDLGGESGLAEFRNRLHEHGLKLILDFVPNHLGLDHDWLTSEPELFVQSAIEKPHTFVHETIRGPRWFAHGKDPYFPAWPDTVQLDYRQPKTRALMIETLQSVAVRCDGVRCDMAMLLLNEVFAKTWRDFPCPGPPAQAEFWADAIFATKQSQPDFLFLAEVYWSLEACLQALGFDYTYDKAFYDYIVRREELKLQQHLIDHGTAAASIRFLENHDEPRIASLLSVPEQKAAAVLLLSQRGMRLLHDGQIEGKRLHTPVQLGRYLPEAANGEMAGFYESLLIRSSERA
jgi:glycosidase